MGIRETINKNPVVTTIATIGVVVIILIVIILELRSGHSIKIVPNNFYTDDDGKTYFSAKSDNIPPWDHDGKEAVRAYVYKCGNGQPFVGYEEKFTQDAKDVLDKKTPLTIDNNPIANKWVKFPGQQDWVPKQSKEGSDVVMGVRCPDGSDDTPQVVSPNPGITPTP